MKIEYVQLLLRLINLFFSRALATIAAMKAFMTTCMLAGEHDAT